MRILCYENAFLLGVFVGIILEHYIDKESDKREYDIKLREKILEFREKDFYDKD